MRNEIIILNKNLHNYVNQQKQLVSNEKSSSPMMNHKVHENRPIRIRYELNKNFRLMLFTFLFTF